MTSVISKKDEGTLLKLFVRDGYVLNFSTNDFDVFTTNSIGVALCSIYRMSKGKSLVAFLNKASDEDRTKLLTDLFDYYEEKMEYEYNKDFEDDPWLYNYSRYNEQYAELYKKCKEIIAKLNGASQVIQSMADSLKQRFSSDYLTQQIDLMVSMQKANPTEAIGKAKELIESCCKTILEEMGIEWTKNDDVPQLAAKAMGALNLLPDSVQPSEQGAESIKAVLGNLRAIPSKLAELRNPFGSGHGKSATFVGLEERHAKLAVGCSTTFVDFIWSTYEIYRCNKTPSVKKEACVSAETNEAGQTILHIS